jgi:hypothetical protein
MSCSTGLGAAARPGDGAPGAAPRGRRARRRLLAAARASETEVIVGSARERALRP